MGLDCTHDAFNGAYSSFNRLRQAVARACGGSFPPHTDKGLSEDVWFIEKRHTRETLPGIWAFLEHSDCDGDISPEMCKVVADELEALIPVVRMTYDDNWDGGHLSRYGGIVGTLERFIAGCRLAHSRGESLEFK